MTILDTTLHPYDTESILDWVLLEWQMNPRANLHILVEKGEGPSMDNKLRVKLSKIRASLKRQRVTGVQQFGINSVFLPWTRLDGVELDSITLHRVVHMRHTFTTAFENVGLFEDSPNGKR